MYVTYVRNHFSWSNNFPFGGGITQLVRNALFSLGGTLMNGAKVASERQNVRKKLFFLPTTISRELND